MFYTCHPCLTSFTVDMTGKKNIVMNYNNYKMSIVETYGVHLVGWPDGVKFISPSNIGTVSDIHKLRDALKAHTCYWTSLSPAEVKAHASELATRCSAGEVVWKPRKNVQTSEYLRSVRMDLRLDGQARRTIECRRERRRTLPSCRKVPKALNLWNCLTKRGRWMSSSCPSLPISLIYVSYSLSLHCS